MPNNACFDKIIPGITLVPDFELEDFLHTEDNKNIKWILTTFESRTNPFRGYADNFALRYNQTDKNLQWARTQIEKESGLADLKKLIYKAMLEKCISKFVFINSATQRILLNKLYTAQLYHSYFIAKQPIKQCVASWENSFNSDTQTAIVNIREKIKVRELEFINDTKQKIGFLFYAAGYSERELNALCYDIAVQLYYPNTNKSYKNKLLTNEFKKYLKRYNNHRDTNSFPDLKNSFTYLISRIIQQRDIKKTKEQIDRIANVHLLFGILGLREPAGWMLENIDIYNYVSLADDVSTLKSVLFSFARPLRSFFMEYVQIAKLEKNPLIFLFRATIPILIMTCFVAFAFSLMVPFAMHAIIEIIMLIPTLYISTVLASSYVDLKNKLFESILIYWRGSRYEQDAFQTNDRIVLGFDNDKTLATLVRDYYVDCFTHLDTILGSLSIKYDAGLLTHEEIDYYETMLQREAQVKMDWDDIHDNNGLGIDNIKPLVAKRLHQDAGEAYTSLCREGHSYIENFIEALEHHLERCQNTENAPDPEKRQAFCAHMRWSMFKPAESLTHMANKCISQQKTIQMMEIVQPIMESRQNMLPVDSMLKVEHRVNYL